MTEATEQDLRVVNQWLERYDVTIELVSLPYDGASYFWSSPFKASHTKAGLCVMAAAIAHSRDDYGRKLPDIW